MAVMRIVNANVAMALHKVMNSVTMPTPSQMISAIRFASLIAAMASGRAKNSAMMAIVWVEMAAPHSVPIKYVGMEY